MAIDPIFPRAQSPINSGGPFNREWYDLLRALFDFYDGNSDVQAEIAALAARVSALEDAETEALILGLQSIKVVKNSSGTFVVSLVGDVGQPGASYYYGTNATGAKGWYPAVTFGAVMARISLRC